MGQRLLLVTLSFFRSGLTKSMPHRHRVPTLLRSPPRKTPCPYACRSKDGQLPWEEVIYIGLIYIYSICIYTHTSGRLRVYTTYHLLFIFSILPPRKTPCPYAVRSKGGQLSLVEVIYIRLIYIDTICIYTPKW